ncbi:MAG: MATE family efflux transporter, partial [Acidobacteriota bacterium]|nr:MATE family efflux transporter [Acidobacteriota bacterium]
MAKSAENKTRSDMLANEKIGKLLRTLSVPAGVGMAIQAFYNVVDTFFISRYTGTLGVAGTTIAFPIQMILIGIGITVGVGGASILSRRMGERDHEGASFALGNMISLSIVLGIICMAGGLIFMNPLLRVFGADSAMMPYARDYISVILVGSPFLVFSVVASSAARAEGNAKVAMFTLVIGGCLNVLLDPIFIITLERGVRGAAEATVISIFVSCLFLLHYILRGKSEIVLKPHHLRLKRPIVTEIFAVGSSDFARTTAMSATSAIFNNILRGLGGATPIAVFGVFFRVVSFVFMPMIGIAQGAQPILGFNYGARQFHRVRDCLKLANKSATVIACIGFIIFMIFPEKILGIFSPDEEVVAIGTSAIRWMVLAFPLIGYQNIGASLFQAIGKAKPAIFLAFSRQVLFLIPLVLILSK